MYRVRRCSVHTDWCTWRCRSSSVHSIILKTPYGMVIETKWPFNREDKDAARAGKSISQLSKKFFFFILLVKVRPIHLPLQASSLYPHSTLWLTKLAFVFHTKGYVQNMSLPPFFTVLLFPLYFVHLTFTLYHRFVYIQSCTVFKFAMRSCFCEENWMYRRRQGLFKMLAKGLIEWDFLFTVDLRFNLTRACVTQNGTLK